MNPIPEDHELVTSEGTQILPRPPTKPLTIDTSDPTSTRTSEMSESTVNSFNTPQFDPNVNTSFPSGSNSRRNSQPDIGLSPSGGSHGSLAPLSIVTDPYSPLGTATSSSAFRSPGPHTQHFEIRSEAIEIINASDLHHEETIGSGGFGTVIRARFRMDVVAVKQISKLELNTPDLVTGFVSEAKTLSDLRCKYVVTIMGICITDEAYCIVTEFMEGGSLHELLHESEDQLPRSMYLQILHDAAKGLHYLHSRKMWHRDIKPRNILLSLHILPAKLCDFGLTGLAVSVAQGKCTTRYAAPEVLLGTAADMQADIYSYGLVLYEVMTRHRPFGDGECTRANLYSPPAPPPADDVMPRELREVMTRCWDGKPEKRPSMVEVITRIEETIHSHWCDEDAGATVAHHLARHNHRRTASGSAAASPHLSASHKRTLSQHMEQLKGRPGRGLSLTRNDAAMHSRMGKRMTFLQTTPLFKDVEQKEMYDIVGSMTEIKLAEGHVLFRIDDPADCMFFVVEGTLAVQNNTGAQIASVGVGDCVGELAMLDRDHPRSATVICDTPCLVLRWGQTDFDSALTNYPVVLRGILNVLVQRVRNNARVSEHHFETFVPHLTREKITILTDGFKGLKDGLVTSWGYWPIRRVLGSVIARTIEVCSAADGVDEACRKLVVHEETIERMSTLALDSVPPHVLELLKKATEDYATTFIDEEGDTTKVMYTWIKFVAGAAPSAIALAQRVDFLKSTSLLRHSSPALLKLCAKDMEEVSLLGETVVFNEGEEGDAVYLIVEGSVRCMIGETRLVDLGRSQCVGELALIDQGKRNATVITNGPTVLLRWAHARFEAVLRQMPSVGAGLIRMLTVKVRNKRHEITDPGSNVSSPRSPSFPSLNTSSEDMLSGDPNATGVQFSWATEPQVEPREWRRTDSPAARRGSPASSATRRGSGTSTGGEPASPGRPLEEADDDPVGELSRTTATVPKVKKFKRTASAPNM